MKLIIILTTVYAILISVYSFQPSLQTRLKCLLSATTSTTDTYPTSSDISHVIVSSLSTSQPSVAAAVTDFASVTDMSNSISNSVALELINNIPEVSIEEILRKDLVQLKYRVDKMERAIGNSNKPLGTVSSFIESITAATMELNSENIEICSIAGFFMIGCVIGFITFDRLWLPSGLAFGYWASEVVNTNSKVGYISRRIGVQLAQLIRDVQEKINQVIIFYRTGKLAYETNKWWDQYDQQFAITKRIDKFKRLAMMRAVDVNNAFGKSPLAAQISDFYTVLAAAPQKAQKINKDLGITSTILKFSNHVLSSGSNFVSDIFGLTNGNSKSSNSNQSGLSKFIRKFRGLPEYNYWYRGRHIDPWVPFWKYLKLGDNSKNKENNRNSYNSKRYYD